MRIPLLVLLLCLPLASPASPGSPAEEPISTAGPDAQPAGPAPKSQAPRPLKEVPKVSKEALPGLDTSDPEIQFAIGQSYLLGQNGFESDPVTGNQWLRKAAEQGNARAQVNLGMSYQLGRGVERDVDESIKWLRLGAEQNHPKAQLELGMAYRDGTGVEADPIEAGKWFTLSSDQGGIAAKVMGRSFLRTLSFEQRREIHLAAGRWRIDHGLAGLPGATRKAPAAEGSDAAGENAPPARPKNGPGGAASVPSGESGSEAPDA